MTTSEQLLTGWGRTAPTRSMVATIDADAIAAAIGSAGSRGMLARGMGASYGDAAQNAGGVVVRPIGRRIEVTDDPGAGPTVTVSSGVTFDELIRYLVPRGYFLPVTPGTRYVSVGGAIAADVHGKNHHRSGAIGDHVLAIDLIDGYGEIRTIGPDLEPDLFWATIGGMGLTGVILAATVRLVRIETAYIRVHTERVPNLERLMSRMRESDRDATYSVAWIDTVARGRALGRSVLALGEHATAEELAGAAARRPLRLPQGRRLRMPATPVRMVSTWSVRAFNQLWYHKAPRSPESRIQGLTGYFHPLDAVADWNNIYGRDGLTQYQFVVPDAAEEALVDLFRRIVDLRQGSFLSVLKRFGDGNPAPLSFPMTGWTLAVDLPADPALCADLHALDLIVADAGGRVYLAKDSRLRPSVFERMYPRLDDFRRVKAEVDPRDVFQSDLARRLRI